MVRNTENIGVLVINKPKKILVVTPAYPPHIGGSSTYARQLKETLPKITKDKVKAIILNSGRYSAWPKIFSLVRTFFQALYYGRYCDLIYVLSLQDATAVSLAAKILKKPYWFRLSAQDSWNLNEAEKNDLAKILQSCNTVILPSADQVKIVKNFNTTDEKIFILSNAFDTPDGVEPRSLLRTKLKVSGKIAVAAGRLIARKNFISLIEAWPKVLETDSEAKLLIVGNGPEKEQLEQTINQLNLSESVLLAGNLETNNLHVYLRIADVFISPSHYEASSFMLWEAKSFGVPVVATNVGDNAELLRGYGPAVLMKPVKDEISEAVLKGFKLTAIAPTMGENKVNEVSTKLVTKLIQTLK